MCGVWTLLALLVNTKSPFPTISTQLWVKIPPPPPRLLKEYTKSSYTKTMLYIISTRSSNTGISSSDFTVQTTFIQSTQFNIFTIINTGHS